MDRNAHPTEFQQSCHLLLLHLRVFAEFLSQSSRIPAVIVEVIISRSTRGVAAQLQELRDEPNGATIAEHKQGNHTAKASSSVGG